MPVDNRIAAKWHQEITELYGMDWDYDVHGNSFHPEQIERALARYEENLRVTGPQ